MSEEQRGEYRDSNSIFEKEVLPLYIFRANVLDQIMIANSNSTSKSGDALLNEIPSEVVRLQKLSAVQRYMEGSIVHPGFLLPWEDERCGRNGRRYFVDLVTREVTWKEPKGKIS